MGEPAPLTTLCPRLVSHGRSSRGARRRGGGGGDKGNGGGRSSGVIVSLQKSFMHGLRVNTRRQDRAYNEIVRHDCRLCVSNIFCRCSQKSNFHIVMYHKIRATYKSHHGVMYGDCGNTPQFFLFSPKESSPFQLARPDHLHFQRLARCLSKEPLRPCNLQANPSVCLFLCLQHDKATGDMGNLW